MRADVLGDAFLYLNVTGMMMRRDSSRGWAIQLELSVIDEVLSVRHPELRDLAVVWTDATGILTTTPEQKAREVVTQLLDSFLNTFLGENPKEAARTRIKL